VKKSFLGKGLKFPLSLDNKGNVAMSEEAENIEQAIKIIIGTAIGERVMRPDFGCRIHDFVFYPNNASTAALVSFYAREALIKWEPRIEETMVKAYPDSVKDNVLYIDISYRIRRTNTTRNLVYPFYLRREQDL